MGKYEVRISPAAQREIKKLRKDVQSQIVLRLEGLVKNPRPHGVEKLTQNPRFWRLRYRVYRIIYHIDDEARILIVLVVRHRKDAFRDIDKLDARLIAATVTSLQQERLGMPSM